MKKKAFNLYLEHMAKLCQTTVREGYNTPLSIKLNNEAQQALIQAFKDKSDFLRSTNWLSVRDISGKKLFGALNGVATGRKVNGRHNAILTYNEHYETVEIDSGVVIPWVLIDELDSVQENFEKSYSTLIELQFLRDMLQIAWNGESKAKNTEAGDLSDVAPGWIAQLKAHKPENVITSGKSADKITLFSDDADYKNLDELASALRDKLLPEYQSRTDLVFLVGADLVAKQPSDIFGSGFDRENHGCNNIYLAQHFGGMPTIIPPYFPRKGAVVTTLKNLSIYTQKGSCHRAVYHNEDETAVKNTYLRRECYIVENNHLMAAIEHKNVEFTNG